MEKYDKAIESYESAIRINSNYTEAYNNKGHALECLKRYEEALQSYENATRIDP